MASQVKREEGIGLSINPLTNRERMRETERERERKRDMERERFIANFVR